jgi:hypothetical protein
MGVKKAFPDGVRVQVRGHETVVVAVLGSPPQDRVLESARPEKEEKELKDGMRSVSSVREKPVISGADTDPRGKDKEKSQPEERRLKTRMNKVKGAADHRDDRRREKKNYIFRNDLPDRRF